MGREFAEQLNGLEMTLDEQLRIHLTANHYPPVPTKMVVVCREVINHINDGGDINAHFKLPIGSTWRGESSAPAWAIIEGHHLDSWILDEEDFWAE